ncbi:DUF4064 domain-containing protein [Listeria monocytogenes]|uniref:DUF4064 domain-containing protein n=1 Tax=Listeria innocua TaxID=1642 RepID=UPI001628602F|nr:DUF4064 domain-containing protein [Listeria innocua]EHK4067752.1 DUF4064 domain-containing protein [Listeria monocytogenes]MBC2238698.1 DUF4064 domain-containing protein [Listeria innocua]HBC0573979.1 DUF4064 domain-containing protein [Listeria monocytogenes]
MNSRKKEFALTLIAGITAITGIASGGILAAFSGSKELSNAMTTADFEALAATGGFTVIILSSVLGIALLVFAVLIKRNAKVFGILTLVVGAVGFFLVGLLWIVPGVLAIIAGIMCLVRKAETV